MPIPEAYKPIIEKLKSGTDERKLHWEEAAKKTDFIVSFDDVSFYLTKDHRSAAAGFVFPPQSAMALRMVDAGGELVDEVVVEYKETDYSVLL